MAAKTDAKFSGKPAFNTLREHLLVPEGNRDVEWEYHLGVLVDDLCPRGHRAYGQGNVQALADELGPAFTSANKLWNARKLGIAMPGKELRGLLKKAKKASFELTASHLLSLVVVKKEEERATLGSQCVDQRWGVKQLRREIHRLQGKQSLGGAPVAKLGSIDDTLQDLVDHSRNWINRYNQAWFGEGSGGLSRPLSQAASARLASQLDDAAAELLKLRQAADKGRRRLRALRTGATDST